MFFGKDDSKQIWSTEVYLKKFLVKILKETDISIEQTYSNNYDVLNYFGDNYVGLTGSPFFKDIEQIRD
jgi:hypothetical protein